MALEIKTCQNCKAEFTLEPEDFVFYDKMKVPTPRVCPSCQLMRRLAYRNERSLYARKTSSDEKNVIAFLSQDKPMPVYSQETWSGDSWDPLDYGMTYDFSKPFFVQFSKLISRLPWPALINLNSTNSEYSNYSSNNTNCYLVFGSDYNEQCAYATFAMHGRDSMEMYFTEKAELCYELMDCSDCYRVAFAQYATNCSDSCFLFACNNCSDCIGCVNLKNKQYCILNVQYGKDEYEKKKTDLDLGNGVNLREFENKFNELKLCSPHKYAAITSAESSTGNNLSHVKNCINCFDVYDGAEDCKNLFLAGWNLKDARNCSTSGYDSQLIYDSWGAFEGCSMIRFSCFNSGCRDLWYSMMSKASHDLFGCFGLRHKSFCILNKQYTEQEYNELFPKVIEHMKSIPFIGNDGYTYSFGDYFPPQLSPFSYNESSAQEYFPLSQQGALSKGYAWKDPETAERAITLTAKQLPADIKGIKDSLVGEIIGCEHGGECEERCARAFKLIRGELEFYRRMNLPVPRHCPNCRHYRRMKRRNPIKLWIRQCQCAGSQSENGAYTNQVAHIHGASACAIQFQTPYAPDRAEIVYCELCYKTETV
ncbi:hypothetical protein HY732_01320 [Candidatus Uhrbacteria bacterium]|nr:hypothetical protein [Candidatus Uhrbacteria bacterium]